MHIKKQRSTKVHISSDSRKRQVPSWLKRLQIIDSTTITLFSNLIFKGVGRNPKTGKKKGGIKVHTNIHANEGVPSDIKFTSAATNDMDMEMEDVIAIYRKRWEIELLFKQLKQNFPLRYFYGESANAIKIQIWVALIANLLLMVIQKRIRRTCSFSGLATMVRLMLMYYVNCYTFLEEPEKEWTKMVQEAKESPPEPSLFD